MGLKKYQRKRNFKLTSEPSGTGLARKTTKAKPENSSFVVQKHAASRLHYDFRLEMDGVLKSWAVPKGPSLDPGQKRLAVEVEDHPLDYGSFEGSIPKGEYGGGDVIVWDRGQWVADFDPKASLKAGRLEFTLKGEKLAGKWILARTRRSAGKPQWLLMKRDDLAAVDDPKFDITVSRPESVITGETLPGEKKKSGIHSVINKEARGVPQRATKPAANKARSVQLPTFIEPQLATLSKTPPEGTEWFHEIKYDGYRTLCRIEGKKIQFFTRSGLDWTSKYGTPSCGLLKEFRKLNVQSAWIDGEICVADSEGVTQFHLLQNALKEGNDRDLVFYAFDLLMIDGEDLRESALELRKQRLKNLLEDHGKQSTGAVSNIVYSDEFEGDPGPLLQEACRRGMEGIISKQRLSTYTSRRTPEWLKSKCSNNEEFLIAGYMPSDARAGFRSLIMASRDAKGNLKYMGRVGTGFDARDLRDLSATFKKITRDDSPFSKQETERVEGKRTAIWLEPQLVAQIAFRAWTGEHVLRQASFQGLRLDKPAREVKKEVAVPVKKEIKRASGKLREMKSKKAVSEKRSAEKSVARKPASLARVIGQSSVTLTHPNKVLIPDVGVTKQEIADYYSSIEKWILPHVKDRPLSLLRCPDGVREACFFQKNLNVYRPPQLDIYPSQTPRGEPEKLIYLHDIDGILALTQMNVLEIHNWGTHRSHPLSPDLLVFDLDPGPGVTLKQVVNATLSIRDTLLDLGLQSFVKVSGGKGFHIHVPIEPLYTWEEVKNFTRTVAEHFEAKDPKHYVASVSKAKREGRIFIDYLRNGYGATSVAPYSLRARDGGAVALPISWKELATTAPDAFSLEKAQARLKKLKKDPWVGYFKLKQKIQVLEQARGETQERKTKSAGKRRAK